MVNKRILIIDDEVTLHKTLSEVLTQDGFDISNAFDGEKGLEIAKEVVPSLILLDIIMPRMNGFKVLKAIKEDKKLKDIPVLALTNLEGEKEAQRMLELGAKDYLIKSNNSLEDIVKRVKDAI